MQPEEIKALIEGHIPDSHADVAFEGSHLLVTVVSEAFDGLSRLKKQQLVYEALGDKIADGTLHAVQMKTLTPAEAGK
ncbi:BolA family protein [Microbulbifer yueqingensis]|uniref:Acid stress-induced BolA-like protein IbaG/YrbA, predicted regulator of iron metabolism n=1 Tax=Microbulbifer yueqingensis TaxID=658219 RepID=A0A1G8VHM1_9GAMM|nr:BolA/IbaG family iron-sulfur metabolism protein [Microbulbifer yueqingensis]SDJ65469.1 Acid stress-induced BolA-like protein IbaG/YrbA, predicted regulator of iron metabolism [Microbulbifer yueqingensis]